MPTEAEMMQDLAAADAAGDTDLAQHIAGTIKQARQPQIPTGEAVQRGLERGLTLGWSPKIAGVAGAAQTSIGDWLFEKFHPDAQKTPTFQALASQIQGKELARENAARDQHPWAYGIPEAAGTVGADALAVGLTGGAALPAVAAGQGAIQGAGYSDADSGTGMARDAAAGGVLGLLGYGAGTALGKVGGWLGQKASAKAGDAAARAAEQAAEAATKPVTSLEAAARERAANAYRQMERIELALKNPALPAEERTAIEAFKATPEYGALVKANARGILEAAPEALAEREAARATASEARAALPDDIAAKTAEMRKSQFLKDVGTLGKSYAEPIVGTVLGGAIGDQFDHPGAGAAVGQAAGLIFGRTRAGKAIRYRLERPGNSEALWTMMGKGAAGIAGLGPYTDTLRRAAARGADALAASQYVLWTSDPKFREAVGGAGSEEPKP